MKILFGRCLAVCVLLSAASVVFAGGGFKSRIITSSPLTIPVPDDHFLRVRNFTQQGGVDRGVVTVTLNDQSTNVLTASRIDTSSLSTSPETMNQVVIAGPAEVTIAPVAGATLFVTYRKEPNEGRGSSSGPIITPTPTVTPVPTATPTATP